MRCSECSRVVKPVVALDIDGTLGDYHGHLQEFAANYLGRPELAHKEWKGDVNMHITWDVSLEEFRQVKLAYRQGGLKRWMPVYGGTRELCDMLRFWGCEIWIATARPWMRVDNIDPDTRWWLAHHNISYDFIIYGENKYHQLAAQVDAERVIAVVDDLPEQLANAAKLFGMLVPIQHRTRWNDRAIWYGNNCDRLEDAARHIQRQIVRWRETHLLTNKEGATS